VAVHVFEEQDLNSLGTNEVTQVLRQRGFVVHLKEQSARPAEQTSAP
jgi:hypothetical protein